MTSSSNDNTPTTHLTLPSLFPHKLTRTQGWSQHLGLRRVIHLNLALTFFSPFTSKLANLNVHADEWPDQIRLSCDGWRWWINRSINKALKIVAFDVKGRMASSPKDRWSMVRWVNVAGALTLEDEAIGKRKRRSDAIYVEFQCCWVMLPYHNHG